MCDCNGPSVLDLLAEQRYHRAVATKHISETGCYKLGYSFHFSLNDCFVKRLHINLAYSFGASHHICGIYGFICGNHHKFLDSKFYRQVSDDARSIAIILNRNCRIVFHHGHMLVCGGMENVIWSVCIKYVPHVTFFCYTGHNCDCINVGEFLLHFKADIMHRCLCLVNQYNFSWLINSYLANHFMTNTSCRPSNQDHFVSELRAVRLHIYLYLCTGQQVFHLNLFQTRMVQWSHAIPLL